MTYWLFISSMKLLSFEKMVRNNQSLWDMNNEIYSQFFRTQRISIYDSRVSHLEKRMTAMVQWHWISWQGILNKGVSEASWHDHKDRNIRFCFHSNFKFTSMQVKNKRKGQQCIFRVQIWFRWFTYDFGTSKWNSLNEEKHSVVWKKLQYPVNSNILLI